MIERLPPATYGRSTQVAENSNSIAQRTVSGLQQSASELHDSPSWARVHGLQRVVSLVHAKPPAPSDTHPHPQQSASVVQAAPSSRHIDPQTSAPVASGAQIPEQQVDPVAQLSPSGRQQTIVPDGPVAQVSSGNVSRQQSAGLVHVSVGNVQPGAPPRQRRMPSAPITHPKSPPPFGQQLLLAPPSPHTSPAGKHESTLAHRRIGRPSAPVPRS